MSLIEIAQAALAVLTFAIILRWAVDYNGPSGWLSVAMGLSLACAVSLFWSATIPIFGEWSFDDAGAAYLEITRIDPVEATTVPGGTVRIEYDVKKRPGCRGRFRVMLAPESGGKPVMISDAPTTWPSGVNTVSHTYAIPDGLASGTYNLWFKTSVKCRAVDGYRATSPGTRIPYKSRPVRLTVEPSP